MGDALRDLVPFLNFKKRENTHRGVMFFAELQAEAYDFTKSIFPPWELLTIFKLHKRYQIPQSVLHSSLLG